METSSVAEALIEFLHRNGVDCIFGVIGDAVFPFFNALGKQNKIKFYGAAHEENAAFMASYYAKLTGKVGVCIATSGPGTANLVNGLADAYFDHAPVLAITGQIKINKIGTNEKQYINQQQLLQSVTKSSEMVTDAYNVLPVVAKAYTKSVNMCTVTHVSIPVDLFEQIIVNQMIPEIPTRNLGGWQNGFTNSLEETVIFLQASKKPLIVVGKAKQALRQVIENLSDKLSAGIILSQEAKGVVSDNHPMVLGGIGEAYVPGILNEADCILLIGNAPYEKKFLPKITPFIQLADNLDMLDYSMSTHMVVGDIRQILSALNDRIKSKQRVDWKKKIAKEREILNNLRKQDVSGKIPIHPIHLMKSIEKVIPKDSIIVFDIGSFLHWFDTYFEAQDHTVLVSGNWRSMGAGLPGAIGALIAQPNKKVIALVGDGGLLMSLGELITAVKYNLPVIMVVVNNSQYNLEKSKMKAKGYEPYGYNLVNADFAAVAKGFGWDGETVTKPNELEKVLAEGVNSEKPFIIDVKISTDSLPIL